MRVLLRTLVELLQSRGLCLSDLLPQAILQPLCLLSVSFEVVPLHPLAEEVKEVGIHRPNGIFEAVFDSLFNLSVFLHDISCDLNIQRLAVKGDHQLAWLSFFSGAWFEA